MPDTVTRETEIDAPPAAVWAAITADGFLAEAVTLELRPGGEAAFVDGDATRTGWIEEAAEPRRLVFWWGDGEAPASRVEVTLEPRGGERTRVRVVESRPLDRLDLVGTPLGRRGSVRTHGPALVAA